MTDNLIPDDKKQAWCNHDPVAVHDGTCECGAKVTWHQGIEPKFDAGRDLRLDSPEFYEHGHVVTIERFGYSITIDSEGERDLEHHCSETDKDHEDFHVRTPAEFRERFPDGEIPSDDGDLWEWHNNAWFDLYGPDGEHLDRVCYSLLEALYEADRIFETKQPPATPPSVDELADYVMDRLGEDFGRVGITLFPDFSSLHDVVDANEYLIEIDTTFALNAISAGSPNFELLNEVSDEVSARLAKNARHRITGLDHIDH